MSVVAGSSRQRDAPGRERRDQLVHAPDRVLDERHVAERDGRQADRALERVGVEALPHCERVPAAQAVAGEQRSRDLDRVPVDEDDHRILVEHLPPERQRRARARILPDHDLRVAVLARERLAASGSSARASGVCTQSSGSGGGHSHPPPNASSSASFDPPHGLVLPELAHVLERTHRRAQQAERARRRRRPAAVHAEDDDRLHRREDRRTSRALIPTGWPLVARIRSARSPTRTRCGSPRPRPLRSPSARRSDGAGSSRGAASTAP